MAVSIRRVQELFVQSGALLEGHFKLSSGLHSDRYLQCALVLQDLGHASELGTGIASLWDDVSGIDAVVSPALGGVIIGHEVARALGCRFVFSERKDGAMQIRRGFRVAAGEKVLVVEDVTTTGGSVKEVLAVLQGNGADVLGVSAIVDRSGGKADFGKPFRPLWTLEVQAFPAEECPMCKQGGEPESPGSRSSA